MGKSCYQKFIIYFVIILFSFSLSKFAPAQTDDFRTEDKVRISDALRIFDLYGNKVWTNWSSSPFIILLVTNENEYLINLNNAPDDFKFINDSLSGSNIFVRPRQFENNLLATFPAVIGMPTIVIGLPENTNLNSLNWILTLLHEHFHQLQYSKEDYYSSVDSLNLSGGDQSGMWMLNYKFPYGNEKVAAQFKDITQSAKNTFLSIGKPEFDTELKNYLSERKNFKELLNDDDYKYFSFQIWQEGIARYTELKLAEWMSNNYEPSSQLAYLKDYEDVDSLYKKTLNKLLQKADSQNLAADQRNCFYTLGALEGLILDAFMPEWKNRYFKEKFYVENYFE